MQHFEMYDKKGINYSKAIFEVTSKVQPAENGVAFELKSANSPELNTQPMARNPM